MKKLIFVLAIIGMAVFLASPLLAALAVDFTGSRNDLTFGSYSLGFQFVTKNPITVTALGFYDSGKDGLTQNHAVGIYDEFGTLLVSTTVLTSDPLTGFFRFHDVTPYNLSANSRFYIMALTGNENYTYKVSGFTVNPNISFVQDAWFWDDAQVPQFPQQQTVLSFPNGGTGWTAAQGGGYFGPNFTFTTPLPASLVLLGTGLLGLIGLGRRRS